MLLHDNELAVAAKDLKPRKFSLNKEHELRFEVDAGNTVTLKAREIASCLSALAASRTVSCAASRSRAELQNCSAQSSRFVAVLLTRVESRLIRIAAGQRVHAVALQGGGVHVAWLRPRSNRQNHSLLPRSGALSFARLFTRYLGFSGRNPDDFLHQHARRHRHAAGEARNIRSALRSACSFAVVWFAEKGARREQARARGSFSMLCSRCSSFVRLLRRL